MKIVIYYIESPLGTIGRNFPSVTRQIEQVLVEITDTVVVGFVNLTDTFSLDGFFYCLSIYFGIKSQLDRVNNVFIELV